MGDEVVATVRAMASTIAIVSRVDAQSTGHGDALAAAKQVFRTVDAVCSRFDPDSDLMRMNSAPGRWHEVPGVLYEAVGEAHRAYLRTRGTFDPRVYGDLVRLGYDRSLPFDTETVDRPRAAAGRGPTGPWRPRFRGGRRPQVHLGGVAIDLGGIGKGLSVRWAAKRLVDTHREFLIDAGGDCLCRGAGPDGPGWRVAVEDPHGGPDPLAVLELRDVSCATSSVRVRQWRSGGRPVHHLIDPRTGSPGGQGLTAVTVVGDDPAESEVMSKVLFLSGRDHIESEARRRHLAALWVTADGVVTESPRLDRYVLWRKTAA
jgi:thiamine biosynthesis lipoprotein